MSLTRHEKAARDSRRQMLIRRLQAAKRATGLTAAAAAILSTLEREQAYYRGQSKDEPSAKERRQVRYALKCARKGHGPLCGLVGAAGRSNTVSKPAPTTLAPTVSQFADPGILIAEAAAASDRITFSDAEKVAACRFGGLDHFARAKVLWAGRCARASIRTAILRCAIPDATALSGEIAAEIVQLVKNGYGRTRERDIRSLKRALVCAAGLAKASRRSTACTVVAPHAVSIAA